MRQGLTQEEREFANFACQVCLEKEKQCNPDVLGCAWLSFDNDYCDEIYERIRKRRAQIHARDFG